MSIAACPGCDVANAAASRVAARSDLPTHELVLPTIHCLSCMQSVEATLNARADISAARVNLSRKRVSITAEPDADPTAWINALAATGFEAHETHSSAQNTATQGLILRLGISGFAMMNVMLLSVAVWSGAADVTRDFFHWIAAAIALPAALFCADPFFRNALSALRQGRLNMDVPISLAILLACGLSLFETMTGGAHAYFDAALSLTFFLLAGRVLEAKMRKAARSAAEDLAALEPRRVLVLENGEKHSRPVADLAIGDEIWLAAGARVPVDGILSTHGHTEIDRSALTGESAPLRLASGETLIAGDITLSGPITVTAQQVGENSTLRRMIQLAASAESARSRYTSLADQAARLYAPLVHGLALLAFLGWSAATGDVMHALTIAIATLIITCPCALGLAVPAVSTVATGRLFRAGILVKSDTALERLAQIDTVVFDKTGTLTRSALSVPITMPPQHRAILKALAQASDHPLSRSLLDDLEGDDAVHLTEMSETAGLGIQAKHFDQTVRLGSATWIGQGSGTVLECQGATYTLPRTERALRDAEQTIKTLTRMKIPTHMLTGDALTHAHEINAQLGLDHVHAQMRPEDKLTLIQDLQASGARVLMIGDGLNDTLALSQAHASIAPGTALEASQNAADVVLLRSDLKGVLTALQTAKSARRRILENFGLAASYNAVAIPFALAGFATPLLAAIAMSTSSILVTLNALRTR